MPSTYYFVLTTPEGDTIYAYHVVVTTTLSSMIAHLEINNYIIEIITRNLPPLTFKTVPVHHAIDLIA